MVNSIDFILAQYLPVHHLAARTVPPDFLLDAMEGEGGRCVDAETAAATHASDMIPLAANTTLEYAVLPRCRRPSCTR